MEMCFGAENRLIQTSKHRLLSSEKVADIETNTKRVPGHSGVSYIFTINSFYAPLAGDNPLPNVVCSWSQLNQRLRWKC